MIEAKITGLDDVREALRSIPDKLRKRALLNALRTGARLVQRAARSATPTLSLANAFSLAMYRRGQRKPGTLKRAISVRTSKMSKRRGDVGVFVNVRPASRGKRGANSAHDPFYWRWINWGWNPASNATGGMGSAGARVRRGMNKAGTAKRRIGARFLEAGAAQLQAAFDAFKAAIGPAIEKLNRPKAPAP
jgi:hypothetical protein